MPSKPIHIVANRKISFFFMAEQYSIVYIYIHHIFFIHSSVDGYLGRFHIVTVVNNAALLGCMYLFELICLLFWMYTWEWRCSDTGILRHQRAALRAFR